MIKDYCICLDNGSFHYALKHFSDSFTRILRCYTGFEVIVKIMKNNKMKSFYTLRSVQNKILKATINNIDILGAVFKRADKIIDFY